MGLVVKVYIYLLQFIPKETLFVGSGNIERFLAQLSVICLIIFILNKVVSISFKDLAKSFLKYIFALIEIILAVFFGNIFIKYSKGAGANIFEVVSVLLLMILLGFFLFLCFELIKNKLNKNFLRKNIKKSNKAM